MCYPLNGSDLSPEHTPLEAGLSIFVDLQKPEFIGREALVKQRAEGVKRRLVLFKMKGKARRRARTMPSQKRRELAEITSGTLSPSLKSGIGMAYIPTEFARINEEIRSISAGNFSRRPSRKNHCIKNNEQRPGRFEIRGNPRVGAHRGKRHRARRHHRPCAGGTDDIVFVELPAPDAEVQAGHPVAVVESVKAASDIYSPISGTVIEANPALAGNPALVNTDPYGEGWVDRLKVANAAEADVLKSPC